MSPQQVCLGLWASFLIVAQIEAQPLYERVASIDETGGSEVLLPLVQLNLRLARQLGLAQVGSEMGAFAEWLNRSPVLLAERDVTGTPTETQLGDATPPSSTPGAPARSERLGADDPQNPPVQDPSAPPEPSRVLIIGASSIQLELGVELERRIEAFPGVLVRRYGKISTGLNRTDYFDWPKQLKDLKQVFRPDLTIAMFGGNDCQKLQIGTQAYSFGTPEWNDAFSRRVGAFIGDMQGADGWAVILGMPVMRSARFSKRIAALNKLYETQCRAAERCVYISTWDLSADASGRYRKDVVFAGRKGLMRTPDGIHFSLLGSRYLADAIVARLREHFHFAVRQS